MSDTPKVYAAMFNSNTHESAPGVISIHATRAGAKQATDKHREKRRKFWKRTARRASGGMAFFSAISEIPEWEQWSVIQFKVKP